MNLYRLTVNSRNELIGYKKIDKTPFNLINGYFISYMSIPSIDIDLDEYVYDQKTDYIINPFIIELKERIKMENRSKLIKQILK
jgi:hypothetical protein